MGNKTRTYAERWADAINETYSEDLEPGNFLWPEDLLDGESYEDAAKRVLTKAAQCLRKCVPATFTMGELDLVRHLMPAHVAHQSGAVRWVLVHYGPPD